jgi:AraC-like DNA-binding protein
MQSLFHGNLVSSSRILYTPSGFAKTSLTHLQETGTLTAQQPHTSSRENLASYLFFIVLSGSGSLDYEEKKYALNAGDCVFLDCCNGYAHHTERDLWQLKWVHFYGPSMNSIYEKYLERGGHPCFHPEDLDTYISLLNEIYAIAESEEYVKDMMLNEKLNALLTQLMRESWHPENPNRTNGKKRDLLLVKQYLDTHYMEKITLDMLAEEFYINKYYLTRIFSEQFGVTPGNYLLQIRITRAKQRLRFSDDSLDMIGETCGMGDAAYFSRIFKKVEGITPGEYRRRW